LLIFYLELAQLCKKKGWMDYGKHNSTKFGKDTSSSLVLVATPSVSKYKMF
jgi:hypothetical protein